jgi:hypothetical protein
VDQGYRAPLEALSKAYFSARAPVVTHEPVAVYWVEQDLIVADEYRDRNVPAGMDNLRLIQTAFGSLPTTITERHLLTCRRASAPTRARL